MKPLRVGVIGLGAIGSFLVKILAQEFRKEARVDSLCDLNQERVAQVKKKWAPRAKILSWSRCIDQSDLVIEAASQEAASAVAKRSLLKNKQVLILSVGGLIPWNGLATLLDKTKGRLWVPSGALAGVDGLLGGCEGKIRSVQLTTRKPLMGLEGAPFLRQKKIQLAEIKSPTLIFKGNALEAIRAFPKNVNVAATLALAGIGPKKTQVQIFTSPTYTRNQHEVVIEGDFGRIQTVVENIPSSKNPKTSHLAILSAQATLKKIFSRIHIGT